MRPRAPTSPQQYSPPNSKRNTQCALCPFEQTLPRGRNAHELYPAQKNISPTRKQDLSKSTSSFTTPRCYTLAHWNRSKNPNSVESMKWMFLGHFYLPVPARSIFPPIARGVLWCYRVLHRRRGRRTLRFTRAPRAPLRPWHVCGVVSWPREPPSTQSTLVRSWRICICLHLMRSRRGLRIGILSRRWWLFGILIARRCRSWVGSLEEERRMRRRLLGWLPRSVIRSLGGVLEVSFLQMEGCPLVPKYS